MTVLTQAATPRRPRNPSGRQFDRAAEDIGNVIGLEHVNIRVPDQGLATTFYVSGLGLTRDPFLMTGTDNMWINVGRSQFHLPTGEAQILRGITALSIPGRARLLQRLERVAPMLTGSRFEFAAASDHVAVTCPWGNRLRCYEPPPQPGAPLLAMPWVRFDVPQGTAAAIARFCREILATPAQLADDEGMPCARVAVGAGQEVRYRECETAIPAYDGHHIAIYIADFSGPHARLLQRGLITEESDPHQYRFNDLIDLDSARALFEIEHEVRSLRHPLYARPLVNRNPDQSNRRFAAGYESLSWAQPYED